MENIDVQRFDRLRKVIEKLQEKELHYELEVLAKFDSLDMIGIEELAKERQEKQQYRQKLERFLEKYDQNNMPIK